MPILSGFLPIPLAMMIPFMGAQSLVLGKQFGEGFQYGKRKISAMSNEEFNKLTPAKLAQDNAEELKQMIPSMKGAITDMRSFQSFIVKELIETVKQLPGDIFGGLTGDLQTSTSFSKLGPSNTAYAGSLGLPAGALKGLVPGSKQFEDTAKLLLKQAQDALNIVQNRKKTSSQTFIFKNPPSPEKISRLTTKAIKTSGATGQVAKIAQFNNIIKLMGKTKNIQLNKFQAIVSDYNRLVLADRSFGRDYVIDVAKSFRQRKIVYRYT